MNVLIFGAGSTGRGHLAALLYEHGGVNITFVDSDAALVQTLRESGSYTVRLLGGAPREITIKGFDIFDATEVDKIIGAFLRADLVLTAVIAENLEYLASTAAQAIKARRQANNSKPLNVICCENLQNASSVLRGMTLRRLDPDCARYAEDYVGFPDAIISRVVPLAGEHPLFLLAEDYNEWFVRKKDFKGDDPGLPFMRLTDSLEALLEKKLWIHNGGHATVAYAGILKGYTYIHEALRDEEVAALSLEAMNQIGRVISHKHGFSEIEIHEYIDCFAQRGAIEEMRDSLLRVVRDPIRKLGLGDRLMGPALYAQSHGLPFDAITKSIANVLCYRNDNDPESLVMYKDIAEHGPAWFLENRVGLRNDELADAIVTAWAGNRSEVSIDPKYQT